MRKFIILLVFAALILAGRDALKRYPEVDAAVDKATKQVQVWCIKAWKATSGFVKDKTSSPGIKKSMDSAKAPFIKLQKKFKSKCWKEKDPLNSASSDNADTHASFCHIQPSPPASAVAQRAMAEMMAVKKTKSYPQIAQIWLLHT